MYKHWHSSSHRPQRRTGVIKVSDLPFKYAPPLQSDHSGRSGGL